MLIPFGEYRPDVADYEGQHSKNILNASPHGDGYGPIPAFVPFSTALPAACRGIFYAKKNDGTISIFAGTSTKLYNLNNTNQTWTDVSLGAGSYTALANTRNWDFCQFNNFVLATHGNVVVQSFDLTSSTAFANLGGSPPQADFITIVNRFVVLSGLASPNVYRVQWSGLNAITTWDNVSNQSNYQDLADGGAVVGVAGGEFGVIFQERSIRRLTYAPGSPYIFQIDRVSLDDGLYSPYAMIEAADRVFFYSPQGFKVLAPGAFPQPIGKERVDRTFIADLDTANPQLFIASADPQGPRVYFAYKSSNGSAGVFDKALLYDYVLDRWAKISAQGQYIAPLAKPGLTLEGVDAAYGTGTPKALTSISNASPAVFTLTAHGLTAGQGINLTTTGTLPAGLSVNTPYYVKATGLTANAFEVSSTGGVGALEGAAVNTSSAGSGTHSFSIPSIETLTIASLDNVSTSVAPSFGGVGPTGAMGYFNGANLEATLESSEHGGAAAGASNRRIFVRGFRPVTDAAGCFGSVSTRENEQSTAVYTSEKQVNAIGQVPARVSTRYSRGKVRIPAGTTWTFAAGIEPDVTLEGQR